MAKIPFPGTSSPAVGFEQPFEMLAACHERVRNSLELLGRIVAHIDSQGHDAQSRAAAADVLRYFDIAAPLHHEDEERHVFPLVAGGDAELAALGRRLHADHDEMASEWERLREALSAWSAAGDAGPVGNAARSSAARFAALYAGHLVIEEDRIFPAVRAMLDDRALAAMGTEMQSRRRR